ncbi:MAG: hypothetical protein COA99_04285 [Moraxellaceae bacterium]|nr:MAG: hypothetical protein COA99_04285 [Moraxellaceae bacterium]
MISLGQILNSSISIHGHDRPHHAHAGEGIGSRPGDSGRIEHNRPVFSVHDVSSAQKTLEEKVTQDIDAKIAQIKPQAAELLGAGRVEGGFANDDFSPEAVADRIMGFIKGRIEMARADGASDEELQSMFGEALKGLEQGLREAKEIITALGSFDGEIKDTFFETVSLIDEGMSELERSLFGSPDVAVKPVENEPSKKQDLDKAVASLPRGNERYAVQSNALFFSQENTFDMEVVTQDGDRVTIHVGAGESMGFRSGSLTTPNVSISAFDFAQSRYSDISFSVEGDLDEGELAALNDLFSQVNDIASSFYSGDVGGAFEQALAVGYDSEELASFAVDMTHSEVVAITQAYREVAAIDQDASMSPMQSMMEKLSEFSSQIRAAHELLLDIPTRPNNQHDLFADLVAELVPAGDADDTNSESKAAADQIHDMFKGFIDTVLA